MNKPIIAAALAVLIFAVAGAQTADDDAGLPRLENFELMDVSDDKFAWLLNLKDAITTGETVTFKGIIAHAKVKSRTDYSLNKNNFSLFVYKANCRTYVYDRTKQAGRREGKPISKTMLGPTQTKTAQVDSAMYDIINELCRSK